MDPFTSKNVLKLKQSETWPSQVWHGFKLQAELQSDSFHLAEGTEVGLSDLEPVVLRLSLEDVSTGIHHLADLSTPSTPKGDRSDEEPGSEIDADIWAVSSPSCKQSKGGLLSWDKFNHPHVKSPSVYLSEAGEAIWDAVAQQKQDTSQIGHLQYARLDLFIQATLNVLVGRGSRLFKWNHATHSFDCQLNPIAITALSSELTVGLCNTICECGSKFRTIQAFGESTAPKNATLFAMQSAFSQILHAFETNLQQNFVPRLTIMEILLVANKYTEVYKILHHIIVATLTSEDESDTLVTVMEYISKTWSSNALLRPMLTSLACRILEPSICDTQQRMNTAAIDSTNNTDDWVLAALLPQENMILQEILRCLQVGRDNGIQMLSSINGVPLVRLARQWSDLIEIQRMADTLESELRNLSTKPSRSFHDPINDRHLTEHEISIHQNPFEINFEMGPSSLTSMRQDAVKNDDLSHLVLAVLANEHATVEPDLSPMQMLSISLSPILNTHHRVYSYALLRSVFLQENLVAHLEILFGYHLFADGSFAARLSSALFDANQYSAEDLRKTGLSAGLRLETRDVWPPASSELRLVLMGLLSRPSPDGNSANLSDAISFAIRDLSEDEMELCRDVRSVHALDFLRLTYSPPSRVLELIITPDVLDKYDRVFKFLLLLLRMHALSQTFMTTIVVRRAAPCADKQHHRFWLELHRFVKNLLDYVLNIAIKIPMGKMFHLFHQVHKSLQEDDYDACMSTTSGISHLCKIHEESLEDIVTALFLKKAQRKIYAATSEILQIGLHAAELRGASLSKQSSAMQYKKLERGFKTWFSLVAQVVDEGVSRDDHLLGHLLDQVDQSNYYRRKLHND